MVRFEEAGKMLDRATEELPQGIFDDLNGGVNLVADEKRDGDGRYIMGLYHHDEMGRYIEIFYGSFAALYGSLPPAGFEKQLKKTLHHELTHHVESKAGDRTLERWDEEQKAKWEQSMELETDSVLFVGEDPALPAAAEALFRASAADRCPEVVSGCAVMGLPMPQTPCPEAVRAALAEGADIGGMRPQTVSRDVLAAFGAVLCMTLEQAETLAGRFAEPDERIMCLGETDIRPPRLKSGWIKTIRCIKREISALVVELCAED